MYITSGPTMARPFLVLSRHVEFEERSSVHKYFFRCSWRHDGPLWTEFCATVQILAPKRIMTDVGACSPPALSLS